MHDGDKTRRELVGELNGLRTQLAVLESTAADLRKAQLRLTERLRFEETISQFCTELLCMRTGEVDSKIVQMLKRLVELLGHDRTCLRQCGVKPSQLLMTHSWASEGIPQPPQVLPNDQVPYVIRSLLSGKLFFFSKLDDLPREARVDRKWFAALGQKSALAVPLRVGESVIGGLTLASFASERNWPDPLIQRLKVLGEIVGNALLGKQVGEEIRKTRSAQNTLENRLTTKRICPKHETDSMRPEREIVGNSQALRKVLNLAEQVAGTDATVLIMGETGTGKELLARAIHNMSPRRSRPLVTVNCGALPSTLIESELFGHERGAYTGALSREIGRFELANGSTIFLDEIGDLDYRVQTRLLRALQNGSFERVGSSRTVQVDSRIIAATNKDLAEAVKTGTFRKDLYYRLNVFPIVLPPLRCRSADIPDLVWSFVRDLEKELGKQVDRITPENMKALRNYPWPGNIRELKNVVERAMIMSKKPILSVPLPDDAKGHELCGITLEEMERNHILEVLAATGGRVKGNSGAAQILGINPSTLFSRMWKLGIKPLHR
ncbi:MAG: sigma 54-interacting transcriptional regulator [Desulfomonilaceae bacterium]